jgi:hypothetical protein
MRVCAYEDAGECCAGLPQVSTSFDAAARFGVTSITQDRAVQTQRQTCPEVNGLQREMPVGCAACPCLQDGAGPPSRRTQIAHGTARSRTSAVQAFGWSLAHLKTAMGGNRRHWSALVGTYAARRSPARWEDLHGHTSHWSRRTAVDRARTAHHRHQILLVLRQTLRHFMVSTKQCVESETEPSSQWRRSWCSRPDDATTIARYGCAQGKLLLALVDFADDCGHWLRPCGARCGWQAAAAQPARRMRRETPAWPSRAS